MNTLQEIRLDLLVPDASQPRKYYDETALAELTASVKSLGVLQPILARPWACDTAVQTYKIVAGERRYRAAKAAELTTVPVIIRELNDDEALEIQITENLLRKDVHPIEEAVAFKSLAEKFSTAEIATRIGKSEAYVVKRIKLADLVPDGQDIYFRNLIDMKTAQMLCRLTPEEQQSVIEEACDRDKKTKKITSAHDWTIQRACEKNMLSLEKAPFKTNDAKLYPEAGACTKCPHNSANSPLLFDDMKGRMCTKPSCFTIKTLRAEQAKLQELAADPNRIVVLGSSYLDEREKARVAAAKELGITILDGKLWEREYGAPDEEFNTFEEFLEYQFWDDEEPTAEELEEAKREYAQDKRSWEKDREEYQQAVAAGAIVEAYNLLDGRSIPIRLKGAGTAMAQAQTGDAGDAAILAEIANIETREARAKELDREKVFAQAAEEYKNWAPFMSIEREMKILLILQLMDQNHQVRDFVNKKLKMEVNDYELMEPYRKLAKAHAYDINNLFPEVVSLYMQKNVPGKEYHDYGKYGKSAAFMDLFRKTFETNLVAIELSIQEKAEKRQVSVSKRIEALRSKLGAKLSKNNLKQPFPPIGR